MKQEPKCLICNAEKRHCEAWGFLLGGMHHTFTLDPEVAAWWQKSNKLEYEEERSWLRK